MVVVNALLASLPWALLPVIALVRARRSRSLDDASDRPPTPAPLVSVIIPARNEAHNISRCLTTVLTTTYPNIEVIVVDDHSSDETGKIAATFAAADSRVRVLRNPDLPDGWFGKQWACWHGARAARGDVFLFADADTAHAPDLVTRAVSAMRDRQAGLLSVVGRQEMDTFWERVVQPQVFAMLLVRYGGTEAVSRARHPVNVIANGQCLFLRRDVYDRIGGHESVRHKVAEDLAIAQRCVAFGEPAHLVLGLDQLSTRMYRSLGDLVRGWRKNVYAGGRDSVPGGRAGKALYPLLLVGSPLFGLAPVAVLLAGITGHTSPTVLAWAALCSSYTLLCWAAAYRFMRLPVWLALMYPLGLTVLLYIVGTATIRGQRVEWKGRDYKAV